MIIRYLVKNNLYDISNNSAAAAGLLAESENTDVRWLEGWREDSVCCVEMYHETQGLPEIRDIENASRELLKRSPLDLKAKTYEGEYRLSAFDFDDI